MSISSLTGVAMARNSTGPTTMADSGELPPGGSGDTEKATIPALLVKQVPTGMVAAYTAVTAGLIALTQPTDSDPEPDDLLLYRWIVYAVLVLGSIGLTYFSYIGKAGSSARFPVAELIGVAVAAAGWGLVVPESPALADADGPKGLALVLVIGFVATVGNLIVASRLQSPVDS